jgi:regulation of enolase protein 1 (concanavalin A-like superfamily)
VVVGRKKAERCEMTHDATMAMPTPPAETLIDWSRGSWLNPPPRVEPEGEGLGVMAAEGSDLWRTTSYGFEHDDGHALLRPFDPDGAVEVTFRVDYSEQFDQAGVLGRADPRHWLKAGVEFVDGTLQLGAVVTHEVSDWSSAPVPDWAGTMVTVRVSRTADALTVRARSEGQGWRMIRLAPWPVALAAQAGPYCCAPTRASLRVHFASWRVGPADDRLHG